MFVSSCESVLEDSLEIKQANRGSLHVCLGKCNCYACNAGESGLILWRGGSLMVFSCCGINLGYILELRRGCPFETRVCSVKSGLMSRYDGHLGNLNLAWQENTDTFGGEAGDRLPFLVGKVILGFLSIFKKSQASSPFEALNSVCLSKCQGM